MFLFKYLCQSFTHPVETSYYGVSTSINIAESIRISLTPHNKISYLWRVKTRTFFYNPLRTIGIAQKMPQK